jgi:hypothetical protein
MKDDMRDRVVVGWGLLLLLIAGLACNAFAGRVEPSLPPPPNPTASPVTGTPADQPGLAATATLPGEASPPAAQGSLRILVDLNIRSGPGVNNDRVGFLRKDDLASVLARDPASGWWKIECPPAADGDECWVSGGEQFTRLEE